MNFEGMEYILDLGSSAALSRAFRHTGLMQSQPFLCPPDMGTGKHSTGLGKGSHQSSPPQTASYRHPWNHQTAHSCHHRSAWCHLTPPCPAPTVYSGAFQDHTCCQSIYKGYFYSLELPGSLIFPSRSLNTKHTLHAKAKHSPEAQQFLLGDQC